MEHRIVIIGGGFGGLYAAQTLEPVPAQVTLIDRQNHHLFQPLLYQVATGELSPANIASPLRGILRRQRNCAVWMAEVTGFDVAARKVKLSCPDRPEIEYDTLIVASGSQYNYFGHDEWAHVAPSLKSIEDAVTIRGRVLGAFEKAEIEPDPKKRQALMTFVIVGGGPTGVELAGALAEVANCTLLNDYRHIDPCDARIFLCEAEDHILGAFPADLQKKAALSLEKLGVTVRCSSLVTAIDAHGATVKSNDQVERIDAAAVLWTAGVKASPLGAALAASAGVTPDRSGRLVVEPDLTLAGHPEIFVIGDLASFSHQTGKPLPGLAPVAMQQGRYTANLIASRLWGQEDPGPFHYHDRGNMATIGRASAVADLGWIHLSGFVAWLAWLFIHLMYLVQFTSRVLVLVQWSYNYLTRNRAARLITREPTPPQPLKPAETSAVER